MKKVGVLLLGVGGVGGSVIKQILKTRSLHHQRLGVSFHFKAVADSRGFLAPADDQAFLSDQQLQEAIQWKSQGKALSDMQGGAVASADTVEEEVERFHKSAPLGVSLVRRFGGSDTIVVDCTATEATTIALIRNLEAGGGAVLANKKPLTQSQSLFDALMHANHSHRLGMESSVGAGTPFVSAVRRCIAAGDVPVGAEGVQGMLSGTLGFLTSGLEKGNKYSEVVREAYDSGYTEPDPRDDLAGMDVARKALILSRCMGIRAELSDVDVEALYPEHMASLSVSEFLHALPQLDDSFSQRVAAASSEGNVLRYCASVDCDAHSLSVGLKSMPRESPLGRLQGTDNLLTLRTPCYASPLVVQGAGAGLEITAAGVIADMCQVAGTLDIDIDIDVE